MTTEEVAKALDALGQAYRSDGSSLEPRYLQQILGGLATELTDPTDMSFEIWASVEGLCDADGEWQWI